MNVTVDETTNTVVVSDSSSTVTVTSVGSQGPTGAKGDKGDTGDPGADGAIATIRDDGSDMTQRGALNFTGSVVTLADDSDNAQTTVTITAATTPERVTELPSSPSDADEIYLQPDPTNQPGVLWHLRYDGTDEAWDFIGGSPLIDEVATRETTTSTSYANLATTGPEITLPADGDYMVEWGAGMFNATTVGAYVGMLPTNSGVTASDNDALLVANDVADKGIDGASRSHQFSASAGALTAKYRSSSSDTANFEHRWMKVTPVRLG